MNDIGAVTKTDFNTYDKYKFRGIDAVMNALNPAMRKNGIFVVPTVLEHHQEERQSKKGDVLIYTTCKVKYTFYADDGSFLDAIVVGEAMDRSDKSTNKAMSAAFKYACFQTFCIPTEEMQDSEQDSHVPKPKEEQPEPDRTGEPAYPEEEKMVADLMAVASKNEKVNGMITKLLETNNARDLSELAFMNINLIKAWHQKLCQR
jgi:hypothetical protein